jgi:hypothetical protein
MQEIVGPDGFLSAEIAGRAARDCAVSQDI